MSEGEFLAPIPLDGEACNVALEQFEGPLDLLLHLIHKHELDILDIPIAFVMERYLEYLALMQTLNLDVAAEYLVMAATLTHLKSRELLPTPPEEPADNIAAELGLDGSMDPREALVRRLLDYQRFKSAAEELAARGVAGRDVFTRGSDLRAELAERAALAPVPLYALLEALGRIADRRKINLSHEVTPERISIAERISQLVDSLRVRRTMRFDELFEESTTTYELVVTFLAMLEMTRLKMTRIYQAASLSFIYVTLVLSDADPLPTLPDESSLPA